MTKEYYGTIFIKDEELKKEKIKYPIELKYYKTKTIKKTKMGKKYTEYGVEIIEKRYTKQKPTEENNIKTNITINEEKINKILDKMITNEVMPINLEDVARDLLIENHIKKFKK